MNNQIPTEKELEEIEKNYDPQLSFRKLGVKLEVLVSLLLVLMSVYHFWASGFGLVREVLHRGIHISFVLALVFLLFGWNKKEDLNKINKGYFYFQNISILDYIFAFLAVGSALYLPFLPSKELASIVGNPGLVDVFVGSVLIILTLEAARRSVGPTLPIIAIIFTSICSFWTFSSWCFEARRNKLVGFC